MGGTLVDLLVGIPTDVGTIDTRAIGRPMRWEDTVGGLVFFGSDASPSTSFFEWAADFSGADDVGIGRSLFGFSFFASVLICPSPYPCSFLYPIWPRLAPVQSLRRVPEFTPLPQGRQHWPKVNVRRVSSRSAAIASGE